MKKTEKIEIRISHEDKERLAELAEHEGQSVSELIRGLARRYVDMNTSVSGGRRPRWLAASALALGGALFGTWLGMHVLYPHFAHSHEEDQYDIAFKVGGGELGETRLRGWLVVSDHAETVNVVGLPGEDLPITIDAVRGQEDGHIDIKACLDVSSECLTTDLRLSRGLGVTEAQFPSGARISYSIAAHDQTHG